VGAVGAEGVIVTTRSWGRGAALAAGQRRPGIADAAGTEQCTQQQRVAQQRNEQRDERAAASAAHGWRAHPARWGSAAARRAMA
jgi:hypothetical protein